MKVNKLPLIVFVISGLLMLSGVSVAEKATLRVTVDNVLAALFINGEEIKVDAGPAGDWQQTNIVEFELKSGKNVIAMHCTDAGVIAGLLADIMYDDTVLNTDETWKYSLDEESGWETVKFDDSHWKNAVTYAKYPEGIWAQRVPGMHDPMTEASWIWSHTNVQDGAIDTPVYFRFTFGEELSVAPRGKIAATWGEIKKRH